MGSDYAYFAAAADDDAAAALSRPGGPLGWPEATGRRRVGLFRKEPVVAELGPAYEGFCVRGYDPVVTMGTLEAVIRGVDYDTVGEDPRWGGTVDDGDAEWAQRGVVTLTDGLRDGLAHLSEDDVAPVVRHWTLTEELQQNGWTDVTAADHERFLGQLRALAAGASARGDRLYCYFVV